MSAFLYPLLFVMFGASAFFLCRVARKKGEITWERNLAWFVNSTGYLFWKVSKTKAGVLIAISVLVMGVLGYLLPGQMILLDRFSIGRAVELNKNAKFREAHEILMEFRGARSPLVHNELGVSYLGMGSLEDAEKHFQKAVKMELEYIQPHANLAIVYKLTGRERDAAFSLRKARSLSKFQLSDQRIFGLDKGLFDDLELRLFFLIIFGFLGWKLPVWVLKWLMARRRRIFDELLPEGLIMATNGLRAGMSLGQALEIISQRAPKPLNEEFGLVVKEQLLGTEFNETMRNLAKRMDTVDTNILVNSVIILREVGGNLTEVFEKLAFTIRERKLIKQKISTMTAEGRTQAVMLAIMPFVLGWLLDKLNPEVFSLLYTTAYGWLLLIFGLLWGGFGCLAMWKIVQVKV